MSIGWGLVVGFAAGALGMLLALVVLPAVTGRSEASTVELVACMVASGIIVGVFVGILRRGRFKQKS